MSMSNGELILRIILCIIFPPLAVFDKGIKTILLVLLLCFLGWIPATVVALIVCLKNK